MAAVVALVAVGTDPADTAVVHTGLVGAGNPAAAVAAVAGNPAAAAAGNPAAAVAESPAVVGNPAVDTDLGASADTAGLVQRPQQPAAGIRTS